MELLHKYPDLMEVLEYAAGEVRDPRRIWYRPSIGFESYVELKKGLLFGGAHSPAFLLKQNPWSNIPWVLKTVKSRILIAEPIISTVEHWVPFLEAMAKSGESLLIVTERVEKEQLLLSFILNSQQKALICCPVFPGKEHPARIELLADQLSTTRVDKGKIPCIDSQDAPSEDIIKLLPVASEVYIRKDASVAFADDDEQWDLSMLFDIAIINVGGKNSDVQQEKLCALATTVDNVYQ